MRGVILILALVLSCAADDNALESSEERAPAVAAEQTETEEWADCEYGCPVFPAIEIRLGPYHRDRDVSAEIADVVEAEALEGRIDIIVNKGDIGIDCRESYVFNECCGNKVCEERESAWFCPADCL